MQKISTVQAARSEISEGQHLTIGLDLGDRWSFYCVLDELGKILGSPSFSILVLKTNGLTKQMVVAEWTPV